MGRFVTVPGRSLKDLSGEAVPADDIRSAAMISTPSCETCMIGIIQDGYNSHGDIGGSCRATYLIVDDL
jgi:hypothetical protein